jgi:heme O synthase-like polyprenyltransferase
MKKPKAWILTLGIALYVIQFIRNFFSLPSTVSLALLYVCLMLQFVIYTLVVAFFVKAASKLVGKERGKRWERNLYKFDMVAFAVLAFQACLILVDPLREWISPKG